MSCLNYAWTGNRSMRGYKTLGGFCNLASRRLPGKARAKRARAVCVAAPEKSAHPYIVAEKCTGKIYGRNLSEEEARKLAQSLRRDFLVDAHIYMRKI